MEEHQIAAGDSNNRILRLTLEGTIANTSGGGLFSTEGYDHQLFLEELRAAQEDPTIKGILFEVNSPGAEFTKVQRLLVK